MKPEIHLHGGLYHLKKGRQYVMLFRVSTVLAMLADYSLANPHSLAINMQYGQAVHSGTAIVDNCRRAKHLDDKLRPAMCAWERFKRDHNVKMIAIEQPVYHLAHLYAGTPDRIAEVDGIISVIDIKTRNYNRLTDPLQTVAYQKAWNSMNPKQKVKRRLIVEIGVDPTSSDYKIVEMLPRAEKAQFGVFVGGLAMHSWKISKGGLGS